MNSKERNLNVVVVGTSIGILLHLPALQRAGFTVNALVGRHAGRAAERAARFGVPHAFSSLADALALPDVDLVVVATPPLSHRPLVLEALAAGKHVLCEKPFARNLAEAGEMLAVARRAGVVHALGTEFRFDGPQALLGRVVREGAVGRPRFVTEFLQVATLADREAEAPQWFDDAEAGGGWFGGSSPHILDRIRSILGEFSEVHASIERLGPRPKVTADDTYTVMFTLASGVEGIIHSSAAVGGPPMGASKVVGTGGTAWTDQLARAVVIDDGTGPRQVPMPEDLVDLDPVPPAADLLSTTYDMWHSTGEQVIPYIRLYRTLRDHILGREPASDPVLPTFEDGFRLQALMDAIRTSAREHHTVSIDTATP